MQLAAKKAAAAQFVADVSQNEEDLARICSKFHWQLARVGCKETIVRENREEIKAEVLLSRKQTTQQTAMEIRVAKKEETFCTTTTMTSGTGEEEAGNNLAKAGLVKHR